MGGLSEFESLGISRGIRVVSIGHPIPYFLELMSDFRNGEPIGDAYLSLDRIDDLAEILSLGRKWDFLFLNCAACDYSRILDPIENVVASGSLRLVAPLESKPEVDTELLDRFEFLFFPCSRGGFKHLPKFFDELLAGRVRSFDSGR